jgi:hypothetical protein
MEGSSSRLPGFRIRFSIPVRGEDWLGLAVLVFKGEKQQAYWFPVVGYRGGTAVHGSVMYCSPGGWLRIRLRSGNSREVTQTGFCLAWLFADVKSAGGGSCK